MTSPINPMGRRGGPRSLGDSSQIQSWHRQVRTALQLMIANQKLLHSLEKTGWRLSVSLSDHSVSIQANQLRVTCGLSLAHNRIDVKANDQELTESDIAEAIQQAATEVQNELTTRLGRGNCHIHIISREFSPLRFTLLIKPK